MRVWYVTMEFPAPYETFAGSDVRALQRAGVDVAVFALRPPHANAAALAAQWSLDTIRISHNGVTSSLAGVLHGVRHPFRVAALLAWLVGSLWRTPRFLLRALVLVPRSLDIFAAVERDAPDVVHLFWGHYPAIVGYLVRRYCPRTVVSMFLGAYDLEWRVGISAPVAQSANVVWTHAHANVPALTSLGVARDRIDVVHRGIDLEPFADHPPRKIPARLMTAGRLHPDKTMGHAVEVFARIVRGWPDASLVVVGDGADRARLEALADSLGVGHAVSFLGRVPHDTVRQQMACAEVFIYMSSDPTDRLPNVVKEAVASHCLCVVSRTTGIEELIRDGVDGWVVERGDVDGAAARVHDALVDRDRAATMVAAANDRLHADFDADRSMRRYVDRWSALLRPGTHNEPVPDGERAALSATPDVYESAVRR